MYPALGTGAAQEAPHVQPSRVHVLPVGSPLVPPLVPLLVLLARAGPASFSARLTASWKASGACAPAISGGGTRQSPECERQWKRKADSVSLLGEAAGVGGWDVQCTTGAAPGAQKSTAHLHSSTHKSLT